MLSYKKVRINGLPKRKFSRIVVGLNKYYSFIIRKFRLLLAINFSRKWQSWKILHKCQFNNVLH
ncbi:Uncharacterized protein PRO82_001531 [Candidatus Protochlamydia amoebophila]|nr:Uncharacterized protein [Candidatus Protochlamydia amoebophila]